MTTDGCPADDSPYNQQLRGRKRTTWSQSQLTINHTLKRIGNLMEKELQFKINVSFFSQWR